jgi:hypothetical protein
MAKASLTLLSVDPTKSKMVKLFLKNFTSQIRYLSDTTSSQSTTLARLIRKKCATFNSSFGEFS